MSSTPIRTPTPAQLGSIDLHLFNEGPHAKLSTRSSARTRSNAMASAASCSASGRRTRAASPLIGDSTAGTNVRRRCRALGDSGIWEGFVPGLAARRTATSTTSSRTTAATASTRPTRSAFTTRRRRAPARSSGTSTTTGTTPPGCASRATRNALAAPIVDLRSASRLVACACQSDEQSMLSLPRARAASGRTRRRRSASRTSSSCR